MPNDIQADVAAIQQVAAVRTILNVVCGATGMGFAAIARVTQDRWAERLARSEAALQIERTASELREQFIAVLGHDLRNPLAAIDAEATLLLGRSADETSSKIAAMMQRSVSRTSGLVENVLDFARGRLGGGFALNRGSEHLEPTLNQVVAELRTSAPDRAVETRFALTRPVDCDRDRIAQLFSNLLATR